MLLYVLLGLLVGSIPFAFWLAWLVLRLDIRDFGEDRNPGGINAIRAGSWAVGLMGGTMDFAKGFVLVFHARYVGDLGLWSLVPVALAPLVGHAFSPFLRFHGGKGVAVNLGIWTGLTAGLGLLAFGIAAGLAWGVQKADAWSTLLGFVGLAAYLVIASPQATLLCIWLISALIVMSKHRQELRRRMELRSWLLSRPHP